MSQGFKFLEFAHTRKVATKIFNIANIFLILRSVLWFKLAVNKRTHQRAWKANKKGIQFCLRRKER